MKSILLILAVAMLVGMAGAAEIRPDQINNSLPFQSIVMDENANITLDSGWLNLASMSIGAIPETYGAAGDGSTDDTNAIKWALDNNSHVILLPGKDYLISGSIDPTDWTGKTLSGYGAELILDANETILSLQKSNITIQGVMIQVYPECTANIIQIGGAGIYHQLLMRDCTIYDGNINSYAGTGQWTGLTLNGYGYSATFDNCKIMGPKLGVNMTPTGSKWITDQYFNRLTIQNFQTAVLMSGLVQGNTFQSPSLINVVADSVGFDLRNTTDYTVIRDPVIWWDGAKSGTFEAIRMDSTTSKNLVTGGHIEGDINNSGKNSIREILGVNIMQAGFMQYTGIISDLGTYNHLLNGNFEINTTSWTAGPNAVLSSNSAQSVFGQKSLKIVGQSGAGNAAATQDVAASGPGNKFVTFGAWVLAPETNSDNLTFMYMSYGATEIYGTVCPDDGEWHWITLTADVSTVTSGAITCGLVASSQANSDDVAYFDGVQLVDGVECSTQFMPHYTPA